MGLSSGASSGTGRFRWHYVWYLTVLKSISGLLSQILSRRYCDASSFPSPKKMRFAKGLSCKDFSTNCHKGTAIPPKTILQRIQFFAQTLPHAFGTKPLYWKSQRPVVASTKQDRAIGGGHTIHLFKLAFHELAALSGNGICQPHLGRTILPLQKYHLGTGRKNLSKS